MNCTCRFPLSCSVLKRRQLTSDCGRKIEAKLRRFHPPPSVKLGEEWAKYLSKFFKLSLGPNV